MSQPGSPGTLADLLPAAANILGVARTADRIGLGATAMGRCRALVVLLVDGLGWTSLGAHLELAPTLAAGLQLGPLASLLPTTTAAAVTTLGTGLTPGQHGIISSAFEVDGEPLWPLSWGTQPNPIATQPEQTVLQRAHAAGVAVTSVAPGRFQQSGLTIAALRGGAFAPADDAPARVRATREALHAARQSGAAALVYVYWPDLDKAGHVYGVASPQWRAELVAADRLVADLVAQLGLGEGLLVTADHGMVDIPDAARFDLDAHLELDRGVRRVLGEPRLRHVYCRPGEAAAVRQRWAAVLAGTAEVLEREEAVARWFDPVDPWNLDRIGDVVAMARGDHALVSNRVDSVVSSLRGQHGADSQAETEVPLLGWVGE